MKRFLSLLVMFSVVCLGAIGCSDTTSATKKTEVSTPNGTTTTTQKTEVEKSGDNPPAAQK